MEWKFYWTSVHNFFSISLTFFIRHSGQSMASIWKKKLTWMWCRFPLTKSAASLTSSKALFLWAMLVLCVTSKTHAISIRGLAFEAPGCTVAFEPSLHTLSQILRTSPKTTTTWKYQHKTLPKHWMTKFTESHTCVFLRRRSACSAKCYHFLMLPSTFGQF